MQRVEARRRGSGLEEGKVHAAYEGERCAARREGEPDSGKREAYRRQKSEEDARPPHLGARVGVGQL
eukprot:CAMPEP_0114160326 /NCGR_PEP_ID=MMETSP0043_2-20121206/28286_1 /TAXON_ID=464988 /ORGANISM="Hemiselmis andersenii, Strain CCMP644" /LENGTH=66 /DNA_ID=CAMNT_0001256335 /DNA_START=180 /DNA_END=380 /DNA_ORIENTATION=+